MTEPVLRVIGTSATLTDPLQRRATAELPFRIAFEILDGVSCLRRGVMHPDSFDIYDQWFHSLDLLWTSGSIQPIETGRIARWPLVRVAGLAPCEKDRRGFGTGPTTGLFVRDDHTLGPAPRPVGAPRIGMLPTTYNVDSFAYARELESDLAADEVQSWAWLLDERWHGRTTLSLDPASSAVELALAARSAGLLDLRDPGDLTIEEIDALFDILMSRKRSGHFSRFWASTEESVRLMAGPGCIVGSLWSPAFYALRGMGRDMVYAAPAEGYRGWHSGLCLSAAIGNAETLDMAYAYLNWWLGGGPGAIMARQGYYMSVVDTVRETLSAAEWDYWYGGAPAAEDLPGLAGNIVVRRGERREGGSHLDRVAKVSVWSTIMAEHNYLARRWHEFLGT